MKSLSIVGCGNVGRTFLRLWTERGIVEVRQVLDRSVERAAEAVAFIGAGEVAGSFDELTPADFLMIATPDDAIADCSARLADALGDGLRTCVVFHCSGCLAASDVLADVAARGAATGSMHPIKSFANPEKDVGGLAGTYCTVEGSETATRELKTLLDALGARVLDVSPESKIIYHAAAVFACNYVTALMEVSLRCFEKAGISRETALQVLQPIVDGTVRNVFALGPAQALTGPIARGDAGVIRAHHEALAEWNGEVADLYKQLGLVALELSRQQGNATPDSLREIAEILRA
ncbi:MAG: hypothetical protein A3K19_17860 [Lentisphaerae bacterium RIFOXYB12_FULL_65_16]|nr:MAG: hypothetical protein A3K18_16155 [Lentisphaerae bacterium RIFOXYA12_64_32]OGV85315.1 MAG: hypothetical protein A3K19_17860 [Lentisphaerae bacterium RIFOXYB12_FULL_65_16]